MSDFTHDGKMEQLQYVRETERLKHLWRMEQIKFKFQYEAQKNRQFR